MLRWKPKSQVVAAALIGALAGGCRGGNGDPTAAVARSDSAQGVVVTRDIAYVAKSAHPKHKLDVYMPRAASDAPVVLFVHGGYWVSGDRNADDHGPGLYGTLGSALAERGVGVVVQSYRLAPEVGIEGMLDDVMGALMWTQQHVASLGGDPRRIFMMGHSAGGHLVALIGSDDGQHVQRGLDPGGVAAYIPISAIWDVRDMADNHDSAWNQSVTHRVFGADGDTQQRYSPITHVHRGMQPFFILIGEDDFEYMIPQAKRASDALRALNNEVTSARVAGNDHIDMVRRFGTDRDNMSDTIVRFVTR